MKEITWGFGRKNPITFPKNLNSLYSVNKSNKIKDVIYLGVNKENETYYTDKKVVLTPYNITGDMYLMPDGKFKLKTQ